MDDKVLKSLIPYIKDVSGIINNYRLTYSQKKGMLKKLGYDNDSCLDILGEPIEMEDSEKTRMFTELVTKDFTTLTIKKAQFEIVLKSSTYKEDDIFDDWFDEKVRESAENEKPEINGIRENMRSQMQFHYNTAVHLSKYCGIDIDKMELEQKIDFVSKKPKVIRNMILNEISKFNEVLSRILEEADSKN